MSVSFVTGGAGFIGAHVTNHLIKNGHKVVVLDDLSGGFLENVNKDALFVKGSILDKDLLTELFINIILIMYSILPLMQLKA